MKTGNLFEGIPDIIPEEIFETLIAGRDVHLERIVSECHSTPEDYWYDQEMNEWVMLLSGSASIIFQDNTSGDNTSGDNTSGDNTSGVVLYPGDYILIEAHRKHRVAWTDKKQKTVWLALHFRAEQ